MTTDEILFNVLLVCVSGVLASFLWATRKGGRYENFHALQLITTRDGKLDRPALMEVVIWALMCWAFVIFVRRDGSAACKPPSLPEWYVTILVGAFVLRAAYSAWLAKKGDKPDDRPEYRPRDRLPPVSPPEDRR